MHRMRWSIIRLIWLRELRDQLRDRRTLFMIAILPLLIYPVLGFLVLQFALGFAETPSRIGLVVSEKAALEFPVRNPPYGIRRVASSLAWLRFGPGADQWGGAAVLAHASELCLDYPPLVRIRNGDAAFAKLPGPLGTLFSPSKFQITLLETDD